MPFRRIQAQTFVLCMSLVIQLLACSGSSRIERVIIETPPRILVSDYEQTTKIPLKVELFISEELRAADWHSEGFLSSPGYRLVLGDTLAYNAENVTREVFTGVVVTSGREGPGQSGQTAVLVPRVVSIEKSSGGLVSGTLTVLLEWTLQDAARNIVWVDTITGEGSSSLSLEPANQQQSVTMIKDLFHKSFTALSSARAIREFAMKRQKQDMERP